MPTTKTVILSLLGAGVFLVLGLSFLIHISTQASIYASLRDTPEAQTALVPGASIFSDGTLSPIFQERVDTALALYKAGKVSKILVSGDNSSVNHNEVNPAKNYLLDRGVPEEDIFLDHAGFDTYSSLYRAKHIFGVASITVATQEFHLPRALFIARKLGIPASGLVPEEESSTFHNYFREIFADVKAVADLLLDREPKYLGEEIPITGGQQESE